MHPMLNIAIRVARKAGDLISKNYEKTYVVEVCKQGNNHFLTNLKYHLEYLIIETIHKVYPYHGIFNKHNDNSKSYEIIWFINAIDNSINFMKRLPYFSVSVAIQIKNRTEISVIYDPIRNDLFTAVRGQGAQLNGYRLRILNNPINLNSSILATNFIIQDKRKMPLFINIMNILLSKCGQFRCNGSSVLDLAYVAANRLDGYFAIDLEFIDIIAGELIVKESGGLVTDFIGGNDYIDSKNIISGNITIVKSLLTYIRKQFNIINI